MKRLSNIIILAAAGFLLAGCGLYKKYEAPASTPGVDTNSLFGIEAPSGVVGGDASLAQMSWRQFFTDPLLQQLIDQVLANNTDLNSTRLAVAKSEASLKAARMAYLPALTFSPEGTISSFDGSAASKTYSLPLQLSVDIDAFGSITNKKRAAEAVVLQAQMRQEAVRVNLISTTAQQYFMLLILDRQLEILTQTDSLWNASLETQQSLWENGKSYSTAVNQMEASYLDVKAQIVDTRRHIRSVENSICSLIGITPQHISRSSWSNSALYHPESQSASDDAWHRMFDTQFLRVGVPATMLELRPDIRMANHVMEEAFYNTQAARSAFFPSISLSGLIGWTNSGGGIITNPGKILLNAFGQLTQPIFSRGKLKANKKIAQLTEEELQKKYVQTVIDAGNQVNEAMADCEAALEKFQFYRRQVQVLQDAYTGTHELMDNGKASYLEVLTAQESLLNAQLNEAMNMYEGTKAIIALYIALGGGAE